jgi:hypothetical protein
LLIREVPAHGRQRRPDDRSDDQRNPSFSHVGPTSSADSLNVISARCPRSRCPPSQTAIGPPIPASRNTADRSFLSVATSDRFDKPRIISLGVEKIRPSDHGRSFRAATRFRARGSTRSHRFCS